MNSCTTTCPYCGVGCGVEVRVEQDQVIAVSGDKTHPANFGKLCVKGSALAQTTGSHQRLLAPQVDGHTVSWDSALDTTAHRLSQIIAQHGPRSVAMYLSGQLLTEDYYVANKLMKGFIGSAHVDTNSRLCMASTVVGYKRAFGGDLMPCSYEDIEHAKLFVLVGSNAAWNHPILFQRIARIKRENPACRVVVLDPRKTASCDIADLHLAIKPGTDALVFNGLLREITQHTCFDQAYIDQHTEGFAALSEVLENVPCLEKLAQQCDVSAEDLAQFYRWFCAESHTLTLFSQGINQSSSGTDKVNAIINCHLATGRIGKAGMGPFSLTGQPNAMGGREVGGLANQLAAHMDFSRPENIDCVQRFWQAPNMAQQEGYKAVDLFRAIEAGEIKAVWIMATNPVVSLPEADRVRRALEQCELVIVSECMAHTDTLALAHIALPATTWAEKSGTVTNSERRISRQRPLVSAPGTARHDWQIMVDVAARLGFAAAFNYATPADIFREHAALSSFENNGRRGFDIGAFAEITNAQYDQLQPIQWPLISTAQGVQGTARLFSDGHFFTPTGRARFIAVTPQPPQQQLTPQYPWRLNTARIRDQWHTMTRTGRAARLLQHTPEPIVEIAAQSAREQGIEQGDLLLLENELGGYIAPAEISSQMRDGELCIPMHWNRQFSGMACSGSVIDSVTDPFSGQPESKQGRVALQKISAAWHGWLLTDTELPMPPAFERELHYWARTPLQHSTRWRVSGRSTPENWALWCKAHLGATPSLWLEDTKQGIFRAALLEGQTLRWMLVVANSTQLVESDWVDSLFAAPLDASQRRQLLAAKPAQGGRLGQVVCSCYQVREPQIRSAIAAGAMSAQALGEALKCGTNCGSCVPELNRLIEQETNDAA